MIADYLRRVLTTTHTIDKAEAEKIRSQSKEFIDIVGPSNITTLPSDSMLEIGVPPKAHTSRSKHIGSSRRHKSVRAKRVSRSKS